MNLVIIRIIFILASFLVSFLFFRSYKKDDGRDKNLRDFSVFFLFFALYRFFLIPFVLTNNLQIMAFSYNIAVLLFFAMITMAFKIALSFLKASATLTRNLVGLLLTLGVITVFYQLVSSGLPEILPTGIALWNVKPIAYYVTGISGFFVACMWVYIFYLNFKNSQNKLIKTKSLLIMTSAFFLGLSSLFHFSPNEASIKASFVFSFLGIVFILIAVLIRNKK